MSIENDKFKGTALILGSSCMYSLMACLIKITADSISSYRIAFVRFLFGLCLFCILVLSGKLKLKFTNWALLTARGIIGGTAVWITYLAIKELGIGKGTVIMYSYPVYASLFGVIILKEKLRLTNFISIGCALCGLYLLVMKPGESLLDVGKFEIIAIVGAVAAGLTVAIIRKLHETESTFEIFFAQCFFGVLLMVIPANMGDQSIDANGIILLLGIAGAAFAGQLMMTEGFRYLPVNIASILGMGELILNYSIGVVIFSEPTSMRSIAGTALIFAACVCSLLGKINGAKK
ncbi:MAG: DMT family transporter [Planctomycetes bacterium]|nr:DMT family transporter [Planctomycetota bacterium]